MRRLIILVGAAVLIALVGGVVSEAAAATLYTQANVLRGPEGVTPCGGANHGKCTITEMGAIGTSPLQSDDIKVKCLLKSAPPSTGFNVFWVGTSTSRGCHSTATGFIVLGVLATGATGSGSFTRTIGNNPFPGNYVHIDICRPFCVGPLYAAVYAGVPIGVGPVAPSLGTAQPGDPTLAGK